MNIYLAGRFSAQGDLRVMRGRLQALGHKILSSWLDEESGLSFDKLTPEQRCRFANRDLADVRQSQLLILDLLLPPSKGGCEVEFGFALSDPRYKTTYIVGEPRNIFHYLAHQTFANWEDCIWHVKKQTSQV